MRKRAAKPDDQKNTGKAYEILVEVVELNCEIERPLWLGAMVTLAIEGFINSGLTYEEFCSEWDRIKKHYKPWFDENGN